MNHSFLRLFAVAPMMFFEGEKGGGGGGAEKPPSLDAQLTASQTRITELERLQTAWTGEKATLTADLGTARQEVTTIRGQLTAMTGARDAALTRAPTAEGQLTTANGTITTLTTDLSTARTRITTLETNPSAQAHAFLAQAGGAAVPMRPEASKTPGETAPAVVLPAGAVPNLRTAIAKAQAQAAKGKS